MINAIDTLIILTVALSVIVTSLLYSRYGRSLRGYTQGDGSTSWLMTGISVFMSFFSAGTFIVWGSITYSQGLAGITIQEMICAAGLIVTFFIAGRWKKTGAKTVAEYIGARYGSGIGNAFSLLFFFLSIFSAGAFLYPVALILSTVTGLSLAVSASAIGLICLACVSTGGLKAVIATDFMKFITLAVAVGALVPLSVSRAGGLGAISSFGQEGYMSPVTSEYTWLFMAAFCLYNTVQMGGNWSVVQKFNSLSSREDARKAGLTFCILYLINPVFWMLPCMACRVIDGAAVPVGQEDAFIRISQMVLPQGLTGLMLVALILTSMSSINAMIHSSASVAANDMARSIWPDASEKKLLTTARVAALVICAATVLIACLTPGMGGIVNFVISLAALAGAPIYFPIIWSLFSKTLTGGAMLSAAVASIAINIFCKYALPALTGITAGKAVEMALGVCVPAFILASIEIFQYIINNNKKQDLC